MSEILMTDRKILLLFFLSFFFMKKRKFGIGSGFDSPIGKKSSKFTSGTPWICGAGKGL